MTDDYFELDLPVAPAVMVGDEIIVEGSDISGEEIEAAICSHLGLPKPQMSADGFFQRWFKK